MNEDLVHQAEREGPNTLFALLAEFDRRTSRLTFDQVIEGALGFIAERLGVGRASVALLTPERDAFRMFDATCEVKGIESGKLIAYDSASLGVAVEQLQSVYRGDIRAWPGKNTVDEALLTHGFSCTLSVPIVAFGRCRGTVNIAETKVDGISEVTRQVLELAAPRLGFALEMALSVDALAQSETRFRDIFETVGDGIAVAAVSDRSLVMVNAAMCNMLGRTKAELLTLKVSDIHPPDRLDAVIKTFESMVRGEVEHSLEIPMVRSDGTQFTVDVSARVTRVDGRRCVVGVFRDATLRQRREDEQVLVKKLDSIRTLAAGIAHDFNNLLTGVVGNISLAEELLEDAHEAHELLQQAEHAAMRATALTRQLLTFAKGGDPLRGRVNIAKVFRDAADLVVAGANVQCFWQLLAEELAVLGDAGQLAQVFQNIVRNAIEAMPDGGELHLRLSRQSSGARDEVIIEVADQGPGIAADVSDKIFLPFFSTKKRSGLGLAVAYSVIYNHGGSIEVCANEGCGSTFRVHLPVEGTWESRPAKPSLKSPGEACVLVMDDESVVRQVAERALRRAGFSPVLVTNGSEAVSVYRSAFEQGKRFDAVVLDLTIPGEMGGREAAGLILAIDPTARLMVSSGYSEDAVMARFREHGFSAVLPKPFGARELCDAVQNLLALPRSPLAN